MQNSIRDQVLNDVYWRVDAISSSAYSHIWFKVHSPLIPHIAENVMDTVWELLRLGLKDEVNSALLTRYLKSSDFVEHYQEGINHW